MNTQSRIPSPEAARTAGEMIDQMRGDLVASESRVAALEAAIKEMEGEHADSIRDMQNAHASEVSELRSSLRSADRLIDDQAERIHLLETNANIRLLSTERVATILTLIRDAANKCADDFMTAEVDAMENDRQARTEYKPEPARTDPGVTVTRIDKGAMLKRLADELSGPLAQPHEVLDDERNPHDFPKDRGEPIPQFLKRGPSIVGEDRI